MRLVCIDDRKSKLLKISEEYEGIETEQKPNCFYVSVKIHNPKTDAYVIKNKYFLKKYFIKL